MIRDLLKTVSLWANAPELFHEYRPLCMAFATFYYSESKMSLGFRVWDTDEIQPHVLGKHVM